MATKTRQRKEQLTHEEDPFLTVTEVAKQLGVSHRTISRWLLDPDIDLHGLRKPVGICVRQSVVDKWKGTPLDKAAKQR